MGLSSRSHVLEYLFSGTSRVPAPAYECPGPIFSLPVLDENAYEKLCRWIISGFPTSTTPNLTDALSMKLLQRLSSSLLFAEYPSAADAPPDLLVFWRKVGLSFKVLQDLEVNTGTSRTSKVASPTSRKKRGRMVRGGRADPRESDSTGISVPITDAEAGEVHDGLLPELQRILEVCGFRMISRTWYSSKHSTTSLF